MTRQGGVSRVHHPSTGQKLTFWLLHLAVIAACAWIALFNGWTQIGEWLGQDWHMSDPARANLLLGCAAIYALRHGITLFYLLARRIAWPEVFGLLVFMAAFEIGLLIIGGGAFSPESVSFGPCDIIAAFLYIAGSWLNTGSEVQRKQWKQNPAHRGQCYTDGLFRHSRHINYFGDVVLFTGWSLFTHQPWTLLLPTFMALMFAFVHIPALDAYLADRYGDAFKAYARQTKALVPYVW